MNENISINAVLPIVETPKGNMSINSELFIINARFEYLRGGAGRLKINDMHVRINDDNCANPVSDTAKSIVSIAKQMIYIMADAFEGIECGDQFTVDLVHDANDFDSTYHWNPHVASVVLTHTHSALKLTAKLYAIQHVRRA